MKVRVYQEEELKSKHKKDFKPMTEKDIEYCVWLGSWSFVKHSSGQIIKCEAIDNNKWRVLGTNGLFPMEVGQSILEIKKPRKSKQW